jgi:hypothetical protein
MVTVGQSKPVQVREKYPPKYLPKFQGLTDKSFILSGERGRNRTFNLLIKRPYLSSPIRKIFSRSVAAASTYGTPENRRLQRETHETRPRADKTADKKPGGVRFPFAVSSNAGYGMGMTVEALKDEIGHLSEPERKELLDWLEEQEEEAWDREMEHDFSPGGRGAHLIDKVNREIDNAIASGTVTSLDEGLRTRRERRAQK